jgi:AcrR family transcriptional regulator
MEKALGVRETKRRETHGRIADAAMKLFLERGYDETTLDEIADAAGISRRTFFYYFASKDDILLTWNNAGAVPETLKGALIREASTSTPLEAASRCLIEMASQFESPESRAIDALLRSSDALRSRKDAVFVSLEADLAATLMAAWPDEDQRAALRTVAMIAMGVLRLAREDWLAGDNERPLAEYLRYGFAMVHKVINA